MIRVPRVTLACVDCVVPALGARAMTLSMGQCEYGEVKLFTDRAVADLPPDLDSRIQVVRIASLASSHAYSRFVMKDLANHIETDFVQLVQWDGYVIRGEAWDDGFLGYDYIGARWWFHAPGRDVGNGGFSLRSHKLLRATREADLGPAPVEDEAICRTYRELLETRYGIRYAPGEVADRYAFESTKPTGQEFGFHGIFNLPRFLDEPALMKILDALPGAVFSASSTVSLVQWLAFAGRRAEALKYAKRLRALEYRGVSSEFLGRLMETMRTLVGRAKPCPCGLGRPYKHCCGDLKAWDGRVHALP